MEGKIKHDRHPGQNQDRGHFGIAIAPNILLWFDFENNYLLDKYKTWGLKELEGLTMAIENPSNQDNKNLADDVIIFLNGIVGRLPANTPVAQDCQEIIPIIRKFFGL